MLLLTGAKPKQFSFDDIPFPTGRWCGGSIGLVGRSAPELEVANPSVAVQSFRSGKNLIREIFYS